MENQAPQRQTSTRSGIRRESQSTYPQSMIQSNVKSETFHATSTNINKKAIGIMARSFIRKESKSASSQSETPRLESTA